MNSYQLNQLATEFRLDIGINHNDPLDFFPLITNKLKKLTIVFLEMAEESSFTICNIKSNDEVEKNANKFASFLLMPINALYNYKKENKIKKWDLNSIIDCEQYFQMSHEALLYRLKSASEISFEEFNSFKPHVKYSAAKRGYDLSLYEPFTNENYTMGNYTRLVEEAYKKDLISNGKREEYLLQAFLSDLVYNLEEL